MYKRSGIIPYFHNEQKQVYAVLMISAFDGKIIDMGGHVEQGESFIDAGLRETVEESRNFFRFDRTHISENYVISNKNKNQYIYFVPIDYSYPIMQLKEFAMAYRSSFILGKQYNDPPHTLENKDFVFLTLNELDNILLGNKVKISSLNEHLMSYSNETYPMIDDNIKFFLETFTVKMKMNLLNDL